MKRESVSSISSVVFSLRDKESLSIFEFPLSILVFLRMMPPLKELSLSVRQTLGCTVAVTRYEISIKKLRLTERETERKRPDKIELRRNGSISVLLESLWDGLFIMMIDLYR